MARNVLHPEPIVPTRVRRHTPAQPQVSRETVVAAYARFAPVYDATFGLAVGRYHRHIGRLMASMGARRVLEVGVGTGLSLEHYAPGTQVVGVDISPAMLQRAQERVRRNGLHARVELHLVDGEELPFPEASFDAVSLPFVVSVTADPERLLREAGRVLAPGASVVLLNHFSGVHGVRWMERLLSPLAARIGFRSDLPLQRVLDAAPLELVSVEPLPPIGFFTLVHLRRPLAA